MPQELHYLGDLSKTLVNIHNTSVFPLNYTMTDPQSKMQRMCVASLWPWLWAQCQLEKLLPWRGELTG